MVRAILRAVLRDDAGNICGNRVATTLKRYATPVPMAISVNMLALRFTSDAHPRWKNGQPHHSTTGVASSSSSQGKRRGRSNGNANAMNACGHNMLPMAIASKGAVSVRPTQKRRVILRSSGFSSSTVTVSGSSAMPHLGQGPGPVWRTSGHIGQTKIGSPPNGALATAAGLLRVGMTSVGMIFFGTPFGAPNDTSADVVVVDIAAGIDIDWGGDDKIRPGFAWNFPRQAAQQKKYSLPPCAVR